MHNISSLPSHRLPSVMHYYLHPIRIQIWWLRDVCFSKGMNKKTKRSQIVGWYMNMLLAAVYYSLLTGRTPPRGIMRNRSQGLQNIFITGFLEAHFQGLYKQSIPPFFFIKFKFKLILRIVGIFSTALKFLTIVKQPFEHECFRKSPLLIVCCRQYL